MDRRKFIRLNLDQRLKYLCDKGEFISRRECYNAKIDLYLIDDFYVEVIARGFKIESIKILDDKYLLYLYVKDLDISYLVG